MKIFIYDNSYAGFLTALGKALQQRGPLDIIACGTNYIPDLLAEIVEVSTDRNQANRIERLIDKRISSRAARKVFYVFLSSASNREMVIYRFVLFGLEKGKKAERYHSDKRIDAFDSLARKVVLEAHRMKGLLRFKELSNEVYYSQISPDHNIVPLIARHFKMRMPDLKWLIHDVTRNIGAFYDGKTLAVSDIEIDYSPALSEDEVFYQNLWRDYFKTIAIKERKNSKLQRQCMPIRYWKHLTEKQPLP